MTAITHSSQISGSRSGPALQFNLHTVLLALRCWWKIATPVALLLATAAGGAVYLLHKPKYTADVWLLIKEKPDVIVRGLDLDSRRFIQNQIEFLRSPRLLGPLVEKPAIVSTPEFEHEEDVVSALARGVKIAPRNQSDIYVVTFTSTSPAKAKLVVEEVTTAYIDFHAKHQSEQENRIVKVLEQQRRNRFQEMNELREKVKSLSLQLTGIDPFHSKTKDDAVAPKSNPFASLDAEIVRQTADQAVLAAEIKVIEEDQAEETFVAPAAEVEKYVAGHRRYLALAEKIERNKQRVADYQRTSRNLASNPLYLQVQAELTADTAALGPLKDELRDEAREQFKANFLARREDTIRGMQREYDANAARLKILQESFEKGMGAAKQTAKQFAGSNLELEFARAQLDQVNKIHDEISHRILHFRTEFGAPLRVDVFKEATLPIKPDELIPWKKIGMASGAALFLPFALVVAWEHLFRRVSSRVQLEHSHAIAVVAEVTSLPSRRRGSGRSHRSAEREVQLFEESIDALRTYLSLVESLKDLRVLAVTSAISREGKTSLAAQLAVSIARATGEPTLLVDGDMRAPDVHEIFDTDLGPGLTEVLKKECPWEEAIETSFSDKLHILTAGRLNTSPHRLVGNGEFAHLIASLGDRYRHIVIDTPPILPASEALVMARTADAAVLCVRRDYSRVDQVQEAYTRMVTAGVKAVGAVLNGIPIKHYAHKYGSYTYDDPREVAAIEAAPAPQDA